MPVINHIDVREIKKSNNNTELHLVIDGERLTNVLEVWASESDDEYLKSMVPFENLCSAWSNELVNAGDIRFVWKVIDMKSAVLPLFLCEEDSDFSCIVVVVEVEKTTDYVYWNKIGYVLHENESYKEETKNGILNTENYSAEDWEIYGDNIAFETVNSPIWQQWINEHWDEELYRRRINYTLSYYQTEGNIRWVKDVDWIFEIYEYEKMIDKYRIIQEHNKLQNYDNKGKIN